MNIKQAIKKIFKHKHKWETVFVNKWQNPTLQKCKCGLERYVDTRRTSRALTYRWVYSDGGIGKPHNFGEGLDEGDE